MPLYEYRCPTCRTTFELLRSMNRAVEAATCPSGHNRAERVVSLVAARSWDGEGGLGEMPSGGGCGSCAGSSCACGR